MPDLAHVAARAFRSELEKIGAPWWHPILGSAGGVAGLGAAAGALGGAGFGAYRRVREAKEQGASGGQAILQGMGGAIGGAGKGALLGAGVGALGGAGLGALAPSTAAKLTNLPSAAGSLARFGQRQTHAFTGWTPEHGNLSSIEKLRMGAYEPRKALTSKTEEIKAIRSRGAAAGELEKATKQKDRLEKGFQAAEESQRMGLTSLPGYVGALRNPKYTTGQVLGTAAKEQWYNMHPVFKAMTIGLPAIQAVQAFRGPDEVGGRGRAERVARSVGSAGLGLATGGLPQTAGMLAQGVGSGALGYAGRGADKIRRKFRGGDGGIQAPRDNTAYGGEHVPTERIMTDRAMGYGPESPV